jgi:type II secretory pathway pseudopilin PulG
MIDKFFTISIIILAVLSAILGMGWDMSRRQVMRLETQIATMEAISKIDNARAQEADKQAKADMEKSQEDVKVIMNAEVSKNCDDAISWGINEAHNFV